MISQDDLITGSNRADHGVSHAPTYNFFSKWLIRFALSKSCALFLCIWAHTPLKYPLSESSKEGPLLRTHPLHYGDPIPASFSSTFILFSLHSLMNFKCIKETEKLLFSGEFEIPLPSICCHFGSNKLIKVLYRLGHSLLWQKPESTSYLIVCCISTWHTGIYWVSTMCWYSQGSRTKGVKA